LKVWIILPSFRDIAQFLHIVDFVFIVSISYLCHLDVSLRIKFLLEILDF